MTISIRVTEQERLFIQTYADLVGQSLTDVIKKAVMEMIEDQYDIQAYLKAKEEFEKNPVSYSLDEVEKRLGL